MTAIWLFLKGVPLWVWAALALLVAGLLYGQARFDAGQADRQAQWDAQKAKDKAAADRLDKAYREREAANRLASVESQLTKDRAIADGKQAAADLRAELIARPYLVREHWRTSKCDVPSDHSADGRGESAEELQAAAIGRISGVGSEAEADYAHLVRRYEQAEKTCGVIP